MVRILCIGDSHIPNRAKELPSQIYNEIDTLTRETLFDFTLFTGDVINFQELLEYLNLKTKGKFYIVMGNMDYHYGNRNVPIYQKLDIVFEDKDKITVGLTHGAQISPRGDHTQLEDLAIEKGYNILVSGHTHKEEIFLTKSGILLINPGSVTGAWSFLASGIPSFVVLTINESTKEINADLIQIEKKSREISSLKSKYFFLNNRIVKSLV